MTQANAQTKSCSIEKCKRVYRAKGYCDAHYKKWRRGELPHPPYKTCLQEGCRKKQEAHARCAEHAAAFTGKKAEAPVAVAPAPTASPEAAKPAPEPTEQPAS